MFVASVTLLLAKSSYGTNAVGQGASCFGCCQVQRMFIFGGLRLVLKGFMTTLKGQCTYLLLFRPLKKKVGCVHAEVDCCYATDKLSPNYSDRGLL